VTQADRIKAVETIAAMEGQFRRPEEVNRLSARERDEELEKISNRRRP
jgi:hypothetical protein